MAIDIGTAATDRGSSTSIYTYTVVAVENPANDTGTITACEIWLNTKVGTADTWVGTFSAVGNVLTCRDSETLGDVPTGSMQSYSGLDIDVTTGDYFGCKDRNASTCAIEMDTSGAGGVWYVSGEYIDADDSTTFSLLSTWQMSLYGTGTEGAPPAGQQLFTLINEMGY